MPAPLQTNENCNVSILSGPALLDSEKQGVSEGDTL
jgi:hypothetical protein